MVSLWYPKNTMSKTKKLPTLYALDASGKVRQWRVWADGPNICTEYGDVGGKLQTTSKLAVAKNVGKANATTPEEQAVLEAKALWVKKSDQEYTTDKSGKKVILRPMLAHTFAEKRVRWPAFIQPKYDGIRCLSFWNNNEVVIESRKGKPFCFPHLSQEIAKFLPKQMVLDGELYAEQQTFQQITSWVKDVNDPGRTAVGITYYDAILLDRPKATQTDRLDALDTNFGFWDKPKSNLLVPAPTYKVENLDNIKEYFGQFVAEGYEGAIVRNMSATYKIDGRSYDLLKFKEFDDDEFVITGFAEAEGRDVGTVVWICKNKDNQEFRVRPRGTLATRRKWFEDGQQYIGKNLTVRYQGFTDDGKPRFPVGVAIRDYE